MLSHLLLLFADIDHASIVLPAKAKKQYTPRLCIHDLLILNASQCIDIEAEFVPLSI